MTLTYEQVTDLLPAYAIGALEAEESAAVEEYIHLQEELIKNLSKAEMATTLLAQGTEHAALAPDAKERMMARIRADAPSKPADRSVDNDHQAVAKKSDSPSAVSHLPSSHQSISNTSPPPNLTNGTNQAPRPRGDVQNRPQGSPAGRGRVQRGSAPAPASRQPRRMQQAPPRGARRDNRGQRPPDFFAPEPKRSFLGSMFNVRALTNATMVASLVTLLFMTLLNFQSEAQLRQTGVDLKASKIELAQTETQVQNLAQANVALSSSNAELVSQSGTYIAEQSTLRTANTEFESIKTALQEELARLDEENQVIAIERATLFEENARLQSRLSDIGERITLVGAATQATVMFGTEEAPGLQGTFFHKDQEGALVIHGLEPLPEDQSYQFWLVSDEGQQVSAGLFAVATDQEPTWAELNLPQDLPNYTIVGISIEPSGGSQIPTGPMLLESEFEGNAPPDTLG